MKIFLQSKDESIVINGDITVTVLKIGGEEVVLEIDAPHWVAVEELSTAPPRQQPGVYSLPAR